MAEDYSTYTGKKVILVRDQPEENEAVEIEGTVEAANELGILIKPKGQVKLELVPVAEIVEVRFAPIKDKPLKAKELKVVEFGNARSHVLERHGVTLEWVNSVTEQQAFDWHQGLDHTGLGHTHKANDRAEELESEAANA